MWSSSSSSSSSSVVITVVVLLFPTPTTALRTAEVDANDEVVMIVPVVVDAGDPVLPNFSFTWANLREKFNVTLSG